MTGATVEQKVTSATLAALILPVVAAGLELLQAFGADISPEQQAAILKWVGVQLPAFVFIAAYHSPHTFRHDLTSTQED